MQITTKIPKILPNAILVLIIFFGIFLRAIAYSRGLPIWSDEFVDVLSRGYKYVLTQNTQHIPLGLALLTKVIIDIFGKSETIIRSIPFTCSLISVIAFYFLCQKCLNQFISKACALTLFAINTNIIFQAQTFKQYSCELMISVLALTTAISIDIKKLSNKQALGLGLLSSIAFWFSYSYIFLLSGLLIAHLIRIISDKSHLNIKKFLFFLMPNLVSFLVYFILAELPFVTNANLHQSFIDFVGFFPNTGREIIGILQYYVPILPLNTKANVLLFTLAIGITLSIKSNRFTTLLLALPIVLTLIASLASIYPFQDRLVLFLFPSFIILLFKSLDYREYKDKYKIIILINLLILAFIFNISRSPWIDIDQITNNKDYFRMSTSKEFYDILKTKKIEKDAKIYTFGRNSSLYTYNGFLDRKTIDNIDSKVVSLLPICALDYDKVPPPNNIYKIHNKELVGSDDVVEGFPSNNTWYIYLYDYPYTRHCNTGMKNYITAHYELLEQYTDKIGGTYIKFKT